MSVGSYVMAVGPRPEVHASHDMSHAHHMTYPGLGV